MNYLYNKFLYKLFGEMSKEENVNWFLYSQENLLKRKMIV
jgi:hypothetical protein